MVARNAEGTARRGFPRWAIAVLIAVVVLALVAGVSIWYQMHPPTTAAAPSPSTSSAPAAVAGGDIPNGCLAGTSTSAAALLVAATKAPHTEAGAVGLAAAFTRWAGQYPHPTTTDGERVVAALASTHADGSILDIPANIAAKKPRDGWVSGGVSFADGRYIVDGAGADQLTVTVGGAGIKNGLPIPDNTVVGTFMLVWENGMWKLQSSLPARTDENLFTNGAALAGGC